MKERPILFQGAMVRALLAGTKTQTRRAIKAPDSVTSFQHFDGATWDRMQGKSRGDSVRCPYGQPGDRLWVREAWRTSKVPDKIKPSLLVGGGHSPIWYEAQDEVPFHPSEFGKRRPSIHMPRWASRITLEVTEIRVERLQDISEADAIAEGIEREPGTAHWMQYDKTPGGWRYWESPIQSYRTLWESINSPESWEANPWVWVLEFKRVEAAHGIGAAQKGKP